MTDFLINSEYSNILYTPLDFPLKENLPDNIMKIWEEKSATVVRIFPCPKCKNPKADYCCFNRHSWRGLSLWGQFRDYSDKPNEFDQPILSEKEQEQFLPLVELLNTIGPFEEVNHIWLWQSLRSIIPHMEREFTNNVDGPLIFRAMIYDDNPQQTFYIKRWEGKREDQTNSIQPEDAAHLRTHYIDFPEIPHAFTWNNYRCFHGSDHDDSYKKILMAVSGRMSADPLGFQKGYC